MKILRILAKLATSSFTTKALLIKKRAVISKSEKSDTFVHYEGRDDFIHYYSLLGASTYPISRNLSPVSIHSFSSKDFQLNENRLGTSCSSQSLSIKRYHCVEWINRNPLNGVKEDRFERGRQFLRSPFGDIHLFVWPFVLGASRRNSPLSSYLGFLGDLPKDY